MALRCLKLLRLLRGTNVIRHSLYSSTIAFPEPEKINKLREFRTESNLIYYEDPDKFGTLSPTIHTDKIILQDEGDIEEEKFTNDLPLSSQQLTTRQYADLIKQYLKHKRIKEAINVLEIKMLQEDRVKPENYIYNILIGACADVGYTKKAFKLFNDMKRRSLKPTGDTYTCLFHSCCNSPWPLNGLKNATHLRELMIEKGIEPNLTNYNAMIKAFGRCGDLPMAFRIVDEMMSKKIKIRVHTFNHLLQACISDKENGLRHALIVWRKMLKVREKPNIYSFNLMLKCVKDCNLGSQAEIEDLINTIQEQIALNRSKNINTTLQIQPATPKIESGKKQMNESIPIDQFNNTTENKDVSTNKDSQYSKELFVLERLQNVTLELVDQMPKLSEEGRSLPNLLSKVLQMQQVLSLQEVKTLQDKFAVIGGQEDFLKEMEVYSVKPDIKTFTQMLPLLDDSTEAENKMLDVMKNLDTRADIDFYNMLIKKRCLRLDYDGAFDVIKIIKKEGKIRKKRFPDRKHLHLKLNIMTYGVLAMACKSKEQAEKLLSDMAEEQLKVNIEILGTLLRQGTANSNFGYVLYIMKMVKEQNLKPNPTFLKHLEDFNEKCTAIIQFDKNGNPKCSIVFIKSYKVFLMIYKNWLKDINFEEVLKPENPWAQFNEIYPDTLQRQPISEIKQPKRFYKRNKKFIKYTPTV